MHNLKNSKKVYFSIISSGFKIIHFQFHDDILQLILLDFFKGEE